MKNNNPPLTVVEPWIPLEMSVHSGDVTHHRQGRAQWWRCWRWYGQEGSVSWRCAWRCWDYSLTSCKDVKTKCQFIREDSASGEATTTYHDVKIQMQPCHLFMLIKKCDFLRLFVWTLGVTSYSWPPNRPEAGWWGRMVRWRAQWWWNRAGKERTNGASIIRWWIFLCHIAIQPNGSRMMAKTASLSKVIDFGHRSWTILDMFDLDMYTIRRLSIMVCKNLTLPASLCFVLAGGLSRRTGGMGEVAEGGRAISAKATVERTAPGFCRPMTGGWPGNDQRIHESAQKMHARWHGVGVEGALSIQATYVLWSQV